jgi:hypothetical protein
VEPATIASRCIAHHGIFKRSTQKRSTEMKKTLLCACAATSLFALGACTSTGNIERNALGGAAIGAAAGSVIGNNTGDGDAGQGAAIGAAIGGAAGAIRGRDQDVNSGEGTRLRQTAQGQQLYYDQRAGRYYYIDANSGRTYWQNGQLRG